MLLRSDVTDPPGIGVGQLEHQSPEATADLGQESVGIDPGRRVDVKVGQLKTPKPGKEWLVVGEGEDVRLYRQFKPAKKSVCRVEF